jgi:polyhydroxyalkanoate synthase
VHAAIARATASVSPIALLLATVDWAGHLAVSPGKRMELADLGIAQGRRLLRYASSSPSPRRAAPRTSASSRPRRTAASRRPSGTPGPST